MRPFASATPSCMPGTRGHTFSSGALCHGSSPAARDVPCTADLRTPAEVAHVLNQSVCATSRRVSVYCLDSMHASYQMPACVQPHTCCTMSAVFTGLQHEAMFGLRAETYRSKLKAGICYA